MRRSNIATTAVIGSSAMAVTISGSIGGKTKYTEGSWRPVKLVVLQGSVREEAARAARASSVVHTRDQQEFYDAFIVPNLVWGIGHY